MIRPKLLLILGAALLLFSAGAHAQDKTDPATPGGAGADAKKKEAEKLDLHVDTSVNLLTSASLPVQDGPSFNELNSKGLFLIPIVAGYAATKGVQAIQKMITDRKNRYTAAYDFAQRDHYFYNQISTTGAFDPAGIQFRGFTIVRVLKNRSERHEDTVFLAKFVLDTTDGKCAEIMNNGIFRLRLDTIRIIRGKVRAPKIPDELNLDFEIDITASYRTETGELYTDAPMGKFILPLRKAPLFGTSEHSHRFYDSLDKKKPALLGQCFMIPRSAGYYKTKNGVVEPCWGKGLYALKVSVKETSKMKFVDRLIFMGSDPAISVGSSALQKKVSAIK
ncbi:MAG: hypothetical protein P4L51_11150 [Puia sp.]|nr:hypothetical protein [Puia sp.]